MRLYYFDCVYVDGLWFRQWYRTRKDARQGRAEYFDLMGCEPVAEKDAADESTGERGDATAISPVDFRCNAEGVLVLLQSHGDANG